MRTDPPRAAERRPSDRSREPSPETTNGGSSPTATPQESATGARQLEIDFGGKATGADPTLEEQRCRALDAFRSLTGDTGTPAAPSDPDEEASRRLERALREDPARFQTESARLDQEVSRLRSTVLSDRPVLDERRKTRADFEALFSSIASAPDAGPAPTAPAGPEPSSPQASAPPAADAPSSESFSSGTLRPWDDWPAVSLDKLKEDPARDPLARDRTFEEDDPLLGGGVLYEDARERPGLDEPDDRLVGGRGDSDGIDGARDVRSLEPEIEYRDDRVSYEADRPSWQDGRGRGRSADPRVREPRGHGTGRPSGPGRFAESESSRRNRTVAGPSPRFPGRFPAGPAGDRAIVGRDLLPKIPGGRTGLVYLVEGSGPVSGSGSLRILYRHPPAASADSWRIPDRHVAMDGRLPDIGEDGDAGVGADEGGAPRPAAAEDAASDEDSGNRLEAASVVTPVPVDRYLTRRSRDPLDQKIAGVLQRLPRQSNVPARKGGKPERGRRKFRGKHPRVPSKLEQATTLVTEKAWRILLPWLVETGRFYCVPQGAFEAIPVVADGQGPLEFHLLLERIPRRGDYHLTCRFVRDQKILLYKSQILLVTEGEKGHLLRRSGKLSTVDFAGSAAWLRALRRGRFRHVPRRKIPSLLKIFERSTTLPPIHFPGSLKIHKVDGLEPRPELKLESGPQEVTAEVTFRYGEDLVRAARPGTRFFSLRNRRLIVRNLDQEAGHAVSLLKQGFSYDQNTHIFTLSADKLAIAAPELFELGWTLHGKKMPFRPPTDMEVNVTTGAEWIDVDVTVHFGDQSVDVLTLFEAMKQGNRMIPLKQGAVGVLPGEWLDRNAAWMELGHIHEGKLRFRRLQSALIDALVADKIKARLDEGFHAERDRLATFEGIEETDPTANFKGVLRTYQRFGLGWLLFLDKMAWGGCLADDMGLGKTVQALALLQLLKDGGRGGTSLVVTPKSLIFNWLREAKRFTPDLKVLNYTGLKRNAAFESLPEHDLVITTYGTMRRDADKLSQFRFFYMILDEAQAIKNAESQNAKAASLLQGERRLILSGTPVENHLGELWSLFDFINPGMLGTYSAFKKRFASEKAPDSSSIAFLRRTLRPFILRRKKEEVTPDLPEKVEETILCEMENDQKQVYQEVKDRCRNSVLAQVKAKGIARSKIHILEALLRLRQAACHPGLVGDQYANVSSGKINAFLSMLDEVEDAGHKVLIFSQFTSLLAIVRKEMDQLGKVYEYLDGQTRDRAARVDRFQNDEKCRFFLISLKAGGLGLNLTAADYVFILDPWWNPAVETQAIDRAHRIGQDKKVFAYRFVSKDSIEERITEMQESKRKLADAIVAADESFIRNLTREDLEVLFS